MLTPTDRQKLIEREATSRKGNPYHVTQICLIGSDVSPIICLYNDETDTNIIQIYSDEWEKSNLYFELYWL